VSQQPRRHRSPKFPAFLVTGGLVGLGIGLSVSVWRGVDPRYDASAALGFLGLICAALGALLGGLVAVLLDRRS
jgi:apolipoprotein N-acyltransferase